MASQADFEKYVNSIEQELEVEKQRGSELAKANYGQMNLFNQENEENLIKYQLDMRDILDRLYHLLKGDVLKEDAEGNILYREPESPESKPFNEFGVQLLMNIMQFYLNRNTILSNYDDDTIKWKVYDFGIEVSDLIHNRYDEMMITIKTDNQEELDLHVSKKLKLYTMIVKQLVDTVHSAYLRAYHGGERESLRTARTVTQNEPLGYRHQMSGGSTIPQVQPRRRLWNPASW